MVIERGGRFIFDSAVCDEKHGLLRRAHTSHTFPIDEANTSFSSAPESIFSPCFRAGVGGVYDTKGGPGKGVRTINSLREMAEVDQEREPTAENGVEMGRDDERHGENGDAGQNGASADVAEGTAKPAAEAVAEAEAARDLARAGDREGREAEEGGGPGAAEDAAAEERRKRREKRRGMAWDKDAHGNTVAPAPLLAVATGQLPATTGFSSFPPLAPLAAPAPSLLQQQAGLTRRARRLHIGSLPPGCSQQLLRELFNESLLNAGLTIGGAREVINDVQMGGEGKFAFIEFRSVREATSAMALDGLVVLGRSIRVQRPNDFLVPPIELHDVIIPAGTVAAPVPGLPPAGLGAHQAGAHAYPLPPMAGLAPVPPSNVASALNAQMLSGLGASNPAQAQLTAQQISRKARRLHVGNLPQGMGITPQMLQQFFNATLMATGLVDSSKPGEPVLDVSINPAGKFAFAEFRTIAEATSALTLNNVELAGRPLRVERPRDYAPVPASILPELDKAGFVGQTPICNMAMITEHCESGGGERRAAARRARRRRSRAAGRVPAAPLRPREAHTLALAPRPSCYPLLLLVPPAPHPPSPLPCKPSPSRRPAPPPPGSARAVRRQRLPADPPRRAPRLPSRPPRRHAPGRAPPVRPAACAPSRYADSRTFFHGHGHGTFRPRRGGRHPGRRADRVREARAGRRRAAPPPRGRRGRGAAAGRRQGHLSQVCGRARCGQRGARPPRQKVRRAAGRRVLPPRRALRPARRAAALRSLTARTPLRRHGQRAGATPLGWRRQGGLHGTSHVGPRRGALGAWARQRRSGVSGRWRTRVHAS